MKRDSPRDRYRQHKANAAARGIEFDMSFREWWEIWAPHFGTRGCHRGDMQMCRTSDEGAYRPGNVRIDTVEGNRREYKATAARRAIASDWTLDGRDRSELRDWVNARHIGFDNPMKVLMKAQEQPDVDD